MPNSTPAPLRATPLSTHPGRWGGAARLSALVCLLALGLLSACSGPARVVPAVPVLHLPHVQEIPGSDSIHVGGDHGEIASVAGYQTSTGQGRALLSIDGFAYDIGLDGSDPFRVEPGYGGTVTASADGHLWACISSDGMRVESLDTTSLHTTLTGVWSPALTASGSFLAVVPISNGDCSIELFDLAKGATLTYIFTLPTDMFVGYAGPCDIGQLAWSPDTDWLAFVGGFHLRIYAISISTLLQTPAVATCAKPCVIDVSATQLVSMGTTALLNTPPSWSRVAGADQLTFTVNTATGQNIVREDPLTRKSETILKVPGSDVTALTWMPDGRQLLFVQTQNRGDVEPLPLYPASRVYIFTP